MSTNGQSIWLEINLAALRRNIKRLQQHTQKPVMAVVKANAYGHGIVEVSHAAAQAGAIYLCVARIEEALKIRQSGIETAILVMGYTKPSKIPDAVEHQISLTLSDWTTARAYAKKAREIKKIIHLHAKIDTGMSRLGVLADDGASFCNWITQQDYFHLEGVFTHFACADELTNPATDQQIQRFNVMLDELSAFGVNPGLVHASNSAATLFYPAAWYDAVRPGIAIYGLNPAPGAPLPGDYEQVLSWKCLLASAKKLPKGAGVGYGHTYFTSHEEYIGVAAIGYADGFRRVRNNIALLRGKRIHQAGSVCMDQTLWSLDDLPEAEVGDEVVLIGAQGGQTITADEIASLWGTINYEVVCGLTDRVHRIFIDDEA